MKSVLYIGPAGRQLWNKGRSGWQLSDSPPRRPVWVVTDMAEESFAVLEMPRLFGRDHHDYVARQLRARFPETPYRAVVPTPSSGNLLDRLAPLNHALIGISNTERLSAELAAANVPIAGIWPISLLLVNICQHRRLPTELLAVFPHLDALRIVFIKNRSPVLTRLAPTTDDVRAQAEEIVRTQRYLENTRLLERTGKALPVLILGDTNKYVGRLADTLELIAPPPPWEHKPPADWLFPLLDLAVHSPAGQVAPLQPRIEYIAGRLRHAALAAAIACLLATAWAASDQLVHIFATLKELDEEKANSKRLAAKINETEQAIARFGITPDLMRRVIRLNEQEIAAAPPFEKHLQLIAGAVGCYADLRLTSFEWRVLTASEPACQKGGPSTESPPAASSLQRRVELTMDLRMPASMGLSAHNQAVRAVSSYLSQTKGVQLLQDPARGINDNPMKGGLTPDTVSKSQTWCMAISESSAPTATTATGSVKP